ncbi:unnamed protein product [Trichogramma brassicae]|uniref:Uncharacterized protein n=1 Tax=Trichogramma brassicae TaxID=86971 RepID=A0A6H5IWJ6_9HYME|nr:unnamed protein product [Trichogramma brassicae]
MIYNHPDDLLNVSYNSIDWIRQRDGLKFSLYTIYRSTTRRVILPEWIVLCTPRELSPTQFIALAACAYAAPADDASPKQNAVVPKDVKQEAAVDPATTAAPKPAESDKKEEATTTTTTAAPENKKPEEEATTTTTPKPSGPATKEEIQQIIADGLADVNSKVKSTLVVASIVLTTLKTRMALRVRGQQLCYKAESTQRALRGSSSNDGSSSTRTPKRENNLWALALRDKIHSRAQTYTYNRSRQLLSYTKRPPEEEDDGSAKDPLGVYLRALLPLLPQSKSLFVRISSRICRIRNLSGLRVLSSDGQANEHEGRVDVFRSRSRSATAVAAAAALRRAPPLQRQVLPGAPLSWLQMKVESELLLLLLESINVDIIARREIVAAARATTTTTTTITTGKTARRSAPIARIIIKLVCRCSARQSIRGACGHEIDTHIIHRARAFLIITRELRDKNQSRREKEREREMGEDKNK